MILRQATRWCSPGGRKARLSILIFHRVHDGVDPLFPGEPDRERFDAILGWLRRWYTVLPLDQAIAMLRDGRLPAGAAAITFDDGYADNERNAMPILQRHGVSATFFVATDFLDGGRMWNDSIVESVRACLQEELDLSAHGWGRHRLTTLDERRNAIAALLAQIKYLEPADRQRAVNVVVAAAAVQLPSDLMMTSEQLRALRRGGMQVGAHTCSHPILARLDDDASRTEILAGRQRLEDILQERVGLFAYPNGKPGHDYRPDQVGLVRALGFDAAVSTVAGAAGHGADIYQLPRFTPWDRSAGRFGVRMLMNLRAKCVNDAGSSDC
jgi:peptidoglycan/xylan/chitin deacetylase (PgdA/CDA1 family)